ncbi:MULTISPECIES: hypothetical protein [Dehalobacter]|jgi:hypothetical protein|uniref:Uncharacterized protein n=2 Tax=Dehalobacter restrictus TaxID=55583 RepID=A0A857DE30_9FIRM|nr:MULTISPECIES: hypothetical protein [Dehalobacter]AHF11215.1 hypothetical protein DEHRE_01650 [Dehalobacter restrictus DSM 9455]MCG1025501.1 hypothetical protein [Dehalobacter sp.]MDJ0306103.1 hypothetical protein [Dehalobacter sp.]QGZ99503.1 hypothetical protein GQ588_01930 [Dehalobacter restrictus]
MKEIKYGGKKWRIADKDYDGQLFINDRQGIIRLIVYYYDLDTLYAEKLIPKSI